MIFKEANFNYDVDMKLLILNQRALDYWYLRDDPNTVNFNYDIEMKLLILESSLNIKNIIIRVKINNTMFTCPKKFKSLKTVSKKKKEKLAEKLRRGIEFRSSTQFERIEISIIIFLLFSYVFHQILANSHVIGLCISNHTTKYFKF